MTPGLAIFVKTPGLSPVKTRLAATIGTAAATTFHRLAAAAVGGVARAAGAAVTPAWAVAEPGALDHPDWSSLPTLAQGGGGLGERMARVYAALLGRHGAAILIGADSPQMTPELLTRAAASLAGAAEPYVLGPAEDGGFWLFGGRQPVPDGVWTSVAYSRPDTAARFLDALAGSGEAARLPRLSDADTVAEMTAVRDALARIPAPVPEQATLLRWLRARETG